MVLILESKRDDLILPYYNALLEKGIQKNFKEFKGDMLDKLSSQAGMPNLSKSSNFYLAGAVRYYFAGELTLDGKAHYSESGDAKVEDQWDTDTCKRLNALIEILRNAYIDSIGTKFEQPEDFGTLTIKRLLRKYGKKIDAVLGLEGEDNEEEEEAPIDYNVGKGYTFDILYSYNDATKYYEYTNPGAWCITYGQGHYDGYVRRLDIHYVIFLKNGYKDVKRKVGPGFTQQKPHDEYGNSMIAVLQSNKSWRPVYITSRWNHGYGNVRCEADHAYTQEEFTDITGVTPEDLQRIYEIWLKESKRRGDMSVVDRRAEREREKVEKLEVSRKLKYAQMKINGGEPIKPAIESVGGTISTVFFGDEEKLNKSLYEVGIRSTDGIYFSILADRNQMLFETLSCVVNMYKASRYFDSLLERDLRGNGVFDSTLLAQAAVLNFNNGKVYMIYNQRFHEFVSVGGINKFKKIPNRGNSSIKTAPGFFEVKNGFKDIALISTSTLRPMRLPNGEFWFNDIFRVDENRYWEARNQIYSHIIGDDSVILEIIYDESSGEKYFYNTRINRFINPEEELRRAGIQVGENQTVVVNTSFQMKDYYSLAIFNRGSEERNCGSWATGKRIIFDAKGEVVTINGQKEFDNLNTYYDTFIGIGDQWRSWRNEDSDQIFFDVVNKKTVTLNGNKKFANGVSDDGPYKASRGFESNTLFKFVPKRRDTSGFPYLPGSDYVYIYDVTVGKFIKNVYGYPTQYIFSCGVSGEVPEGEQEFLCYRIDGSFTADVRNRFFADATWQSGQANSWERCRERANAEEMKHVKFLDKSNVTYIEDRTQPDMGRERSQTVGEPMLANRINEAVKAAFKKLKENGVL